MSVQDLRLFPLSPSSIQLPVTPAPVIAIPFVDSLNFILSAVEEADDAISTGVTG
ncbi:MAG: hypothetical protein RMX96_31710 [Nostoc sp. ChiSLP02]|nr:hypothetical protein [Nostoc sp. ChiSLP02]